MLTLSPAVRKSTNLIINFAQRESKARYKRSLLGWFWSFANPATTVAVYTFVFSRVFRAEIPPTANGNAENFGLFLFTGLIVWSLFTGVINGCMDWLQGVSDLRKKIYFPTETALLGGAASNAIQTGLEAAVLLVIMAVLSNISWTAIFLLLSLLLTMAFALGLGFIFSVMNARYRDIQYLVGVLLSVGFFLVPIIYPIDLVPEEEWGLPAKALVEWSPPGVFVEIARDGAYFLQVPEAGKLVVAFAYSTVMFSIGWVYFRARSMEISEEP
jgi:ABC-type polysaccharide/polyol phosphate export permease